MIWCDVLTHIYVPDNVYLTDLYAAISGIQSIPGSASKKPETFTTQPRSQVQGTLNESRQPEETESRQPLNHLQATRNLHQTPLNQAQGTESRNLHQAMMEPSPDNE